MRSWSLARLIFAASAGAAILVSSIVVAVGKADPRDSRAQVTAADVSVSQLLAEANRDFAYRGQPINPRAVQELLSWISDSLPGPVSIDLAGTWNSNRYFGEFARRAGGDVFIDLKTAQVGPAADNPGWFAYRRIGTLTSGVHVVETWENRGGSGVFTNLLLVRFVVDQEHSSGERRQRLLMVRVGEEPLGDRYSGEVVVKGNVITIAAGGRDRAKPRTLTLDWLK
jgi:hypothetical protein